MAQDQNPNQILNDESSRLQSALDSCRHLIANYRTMLTSNDNAADESVNDGLESEQAEI